MATPSIYRADEPSFEWNAANKPKGAGWFDVRPPGVPHDAVPIYDTGLDGVIGYQREVGGVTRVYTLDGDLSISEKPLEAPLIDPFDVVLIVGGIWRAGLRGLTEWGLEGASVPLGRATLYGLRTRYHALLRRPLRFAAAPLAHMAEPARYVPIHILRLAIRFGKRVGDPAGHVGVFQYHCRMTRNGTQYMLEVVVREHDYTVLHFAYKHLR